MLPKVTTALSQFIKPISSSTQQQTVGEKRHKEERKNFQRFGSESEERPKLKEVKSSDQINPLTTPKFDPTKLSVASSFLQLLTTLQKKHSLLNCWKGLQTYFSMARSSKKASKFRKGTLIDNRIE
jgi:hypothetical protein